jgi:hypothetical protein
MRTWVLGVAVMVAGCEVGGLHWDVHQAGDQDGGVDIAVGDIAVAPDGSYFVFERGGALMVGWTDTGVVEALPVQDPGRLAFSRQRSVVYVSTLTGELVAVDVEAAAVRWSTATGVGGAVFGGRLEVSADDARVVVGLGRSVVLVDAADGATVAQVALTNTLVDLELLPDNERMLVVEQHVWPEEVLLPTTTVQVVSLADGAARSFEVPNCADDVVVPAHGGLGLLAPTLCERAGEGVDPISHLDLSPGAEGFVRNLPGFGPVAMAPDGSTAIGFYDATLGDAALFDDPTAMPPAEPRFHLMVLDTNDLSYRFYPYGPALPRYALTPDGEVLLVDEILGETAWLFDVDSGALREVTGGMPRYDKLAFSGDASRAWVLSDMETGREGDTYFLHYALWDLDIATAAADEVPLPFRPRNLNVSPDDAWLFLRQDEERVCVFEVARGACRREVGLSGR